MKKKLIILILILLLTGCSAKYDINFGKDKIEDKIEIFEDSTKVNKANEEETDEINNLIIDWENGYDHYKRELYSTDTIDGYRYTYEFDYDEYDAMSQIRKCYDDFKLTYDKEIKLTTSKEFLCGTYYPDTKQIEINITSEYEIKSSNADKKDKNKHTWIINKDNYKNKPITITINKNKEYTEKKESKIEIKKIIVTSIFVILIIVLIKRKRRNN